MPVVDDTKPQSPASKSEDEAKKQASTPVVSSAFKGMIAELVVVQNKIEDLKEVEKSLKTTILSDFPEEPGDHVIEKDGYKVTVSIPEKWTWDKKELEEKFGEGELPDYVQRNLTINRKKFEALPATEQATVMGALTIGPGNPKIKVEAS